MCSKKIQRLQRIQLVFSTVSFEFKLSINLKIYWFNSRLSKRCQWKITLLPMQELQNTQIELLDWEDPLKEEMAAHSSILAQKISWPAESGRLKSIRLQRVRHDWSDFHLRNWMNTLYKDSEKVQVFNIELAKELPIYCFFQIWKSFVLWIVCLLFFSYQDQKHIQVTQSDKNLWYVNTKRRPQ